MKVNKLFLSALALAVTTPALMQPIQVDASAKFFKDVPESNWAYAIIHEMRDQNIISGYEDGTFHPAEVITRKHAAALISRVKDLPAVKPFTAFKDVSEKNTYYSDIKKLQQAGIFAPDNRGNYNPNQAITRAEMAKVLAIAFGLDVKATKDFPDVPFGHPANEYVRAIYSNGITTGDNGLFKPDESLTRAHYAVFMHRAMNTEKEIVQEHEGKEQGFNENTKYAEMIDVYAMKKEDIPRPNGVTIEKQKAKQVEIRVREKHTVNGTSGIANDIRSNSEKGSPVYNSTAEVTHRSMIAKAKLSNLTPEEFVALVNRVIQTGEVYDGGNFSLFYNYDDGLLHYSNRR